MDYLQKLNRLEQDTPKTSADWLAAWRELARVTAGIDRDDPRFEPVFRWLNACDTAFALGSWSTFKEAAAEVKRIARGGR